MTADLPQDHTELDRLRAGRAPAVASCCFSAAFSARRHRVRAVVAAVLAFLTGLLMITAVVSVWTTRTALNTDKFVARVGPVIEQPAVQDAIATEVSTQLAGYLQPKVAAALPDNLQFLAAPISSGLQTVIDKQVRKVIGSDAFTKVWDQALTLSHQEVVSVLKGDNQAVAVVNGKVVIDLIPVVNEVLQNMSAQLPTIFGQTISLQLPANASLDRIRSAVSTYLGVQLPPDFAQIPIANESDLTAAQSGVKIVNTSTVLVVLLALLALVLRRLAHLGGRRPGPAGHAGAQPHREASGADEVHDHGQHQPGPEQDQRELAQRGEQRPQRHGRRVGEVRGGDARHRVAHDPADHEEDQRGEAGGPQPDLQQGPPARRRDDDREHEGQQGEQHDEHGRRVDDLHAALGRREVGLVGDRDLGEVRG